MKYFHLRQFGSTGAVIADISSLCLLTHLRSIHLIVCYITGWSTDTPISKEKIKGPIASF